MKVFLGILLGIFLILGISYAGIISNPPPLADSPVELGHYLTDIKNNMNRPAITTTAPNASRSGQKGDLVLYNNAGTYSLYCNTDGATAWQVL